MDIGYRLHVNLLCNLVWCAEAQQPKDASTLEPQKTVEGIWKTNQTWCPPELNSGVLPSSQSFDYSLPGLHALALILVSVLLRRQELDG